MHASRRHPTLAALLLAAAALLTVACDPGIEADPPPTGEPPVVPVLDPNTRVLPLPNDAALDADGTLPATAPDAPEDSAERAFSDWFDQIHGWLPEDAHHDPI